jgi:serine protease AprX
LSLTVVVSGCDDHGRGKEMPVLGTDRLWGTRTRRVAALAALVLAGSSVVGASTAEAYVGGVESVASPGSRPSAAGVRGDGGWSWDSGSTDGGGTSMRNVRSIINAAAGTAATLTGQGVGVALIDTGVAPVPGLPAGQLVHGPDLSFESQSSQLRYLDTYGHGTHMAGIIVGNDGATGTVGIAPRAKVTSVKVGTANGAVDVSQVVAAIDWVVQNRGHDPAHPIRVLNLSYGSGGWSDHTVDVLQHSVEQAWRAGIVVVVAGGNNGNATVRLTNPATDPYVLAVGAASTKGTLSPADDDVAVFSNLSTGPRTVDLLAPGESILSLRDPGSNIDETYPHARVGETLFKGSGSSQAAAVTSAAVALLLQHRPTLTPDQVKRILIESGTVLSAGLAKKKNLRELNVGAALTLTTPSTTQSWAKSTGTGPIEAARGASHVVRDGAELAGERSVFGPFASASWASRASARTAWSGGAWMGHQVAGNGWTGAGGTVATGQISGYAGKCVDISGANTANGTAVQLYDCNNTGAQYWSLELNGTVKALGKCLDVVSQATGNGTKAHLWDCHGGPSQQWRVDSNRHLVNANAGRCLDIPNWATTSGTQLQLWDCADQDNQRWMVPFASKTWGAVTWPGTAWNGGSWIDPDWSGRYWSGRYWSGRYWSGRYWSANDWSTTLWR